jgi:hypothetical protein
MQYAIIERTGTLTIRFGVAETGPLPSRRYNVTEDYHKIPRVFEPREGHLKIQDGKQTSITFYGPRILKGGRLSETERFVATWTHDTIGQAPEWVRTIWHEAGA